MTQFVKAGTTDVTTKIFIFDSTDGSPETGVDYNTSGIDLWYWRFGSTKTSITEAALAALDSAHSDGGIEHCGNGEYRLDLPDAACAAGAKYCLVGGTVTGMIVIGELIHLTSFDPFDAVRMGMTALPNAAADAAGGLAISDAGGLDLDAKLANTNEVTAARMGALTDWIDGGRLDLLIDAIKAMTDKIGTVTNSGGTATIGAILGDFANSALAGRVTDARMGALTDWINGGRLDLLLDAIKAKTDSLTFTVAGDVDCNVQSWAGAAAPAMTGDAYARLGAPAGASVSADIAAVKTQTGAIETDTQDLQTQIGAAGAGLSAVPWNAAWDAEVQSEVFDALDAAFTDATGLTGNGLLDRIRTIGWILRNKIDVTDANGNTTIYKDDSTTGAFTVAGMLTDDSTTTTRLRAA